MNWISSSLPSAQAIPEGHTPALAATGTSEVSGATRKDATGFYSASTSAATPSSILRSGALVLIEEDDDRRPGTPRNASPLLAGTSHDENSQDVKDHLLVFGYGCKIFRDDERAMWVEKHKHLIPWMGNSDLLIDRYDCRGALMDITRYESGATFETAVEEDNQTFYVEEQVSDTELDEERYRDLNEDEDYDESAYGREMDYCRLETAMNGMVTESRLQATTSDNTSRHAAFQYSYDERSHDISIGPEPKRLHEEDAPYVKPVGLYIPEELILPSTMKIHAIIEKTAQFIAGHGNQMEIILKTKQSGNRLFDFLTHSGLLNPYYKFLVHAIRNGIYRPTTTDADMDTSTSSALDISSEHSEEDADHTYLHPSLFRTSSSVTHSTAPPVSAIDSIASSYPSSSARHNAYSMLVSKIKGTDSPDNLSAPVTTTFQQGNIYLGQGSSNHYTNYGYQVPPTQQPVTQQRPQKQLPSTQDQLIIEKMASYVIKNGANFEELAKRKGDTRFGFLNPSHEYHWYYLNCKERFKAETSAVVASSDFVNYTSGSSGSGGATKTNSSTTSATSSSTGLSPRKSAIVAELAARKNSGLLAKKEKDTKTVSSGITGGLSTSTENVFSQANLVGSSAKEKEKPMIRFATTLSLNNLSQMPATKDSEIPASSIVDSKGEPSSCKYAPLEPMTKGKQEAQPPLIQLPSEESEEEGLIHTDSDICPLDEDSRGGANSSPTSEDDAEKARRRLERKRKAALFLQNLKMSKLASAPEVPDSNRKSTPAPVPLPTAVIAGSSLGDLLSKRLQEADLERAATALAAHSEETPTAYYENNLSSESRSRNHYDDGGNNDLGNGTGSSGSSRHSSRCRSRNYAVSGGGSSSRSRKSKRRRRSRSYSSTGSVSSSTSSAYDGGSSHVSHSKKKSSKKKHKKKKKKHDKSSSSRKSRKR